MKIHYDDEGTPLYATFDAPAIVSSEEKIKALMSQMDFLEECLVEMATKVYSE